jgi:hypothetical protein
VGKKSEISDRSGLGKKEKFLTGPGWAKKSEIFDKFKMGEKSEIFNSSEKNLKTFHWKYANKIASPLTI